MERFVDGCAGSCRAEPVDALEPTGTAVVRADVVQAHADAPYRLSDIGVVVTGRFERAEYGQEIDRVREQQIEPVGDSPHIRILLSGEARGRRLHGAADL